MSGDALSRVTGHLRVEERARSGRVWVATYVARDGVKRRTSLGPAWVRDSGRTTDRGAVVWRAAGGTCPAGHLTPKAAQEALDVLLAAERSKPGRRPLQRGMSFGDAADAFLRHAASVGGARGAVAPTTMRGYRSVIAVLAAEFPPEVALAKVTSSAVERYQERLLVEVPDGRNEPLARSTVRQRMLVLRAILERAVVLGWLGTNPAAGVRLIPQPTAEPDFNVIEPSHVEAVARAIEELGEDELPYYRRAAGAEGRVDEARLEAMRERRELWADVVRIAAYTGLRLGELRALRWRDVDFAGATLHVRRNAPVSAPAGSQVKVPKSCYARSVPLIDLAAAVLDRVSRHLDEHGLPTDAEALVFPTREGGMLDAARVRKAFYRGLDRAGLGHLRAKENPMTFHDLRHVFGTIAVRAFPVTDVQAFMGHQSITTTMRYVHHVPRHDAAAKLSAAFAVDLVADAPGMAPA